MAVSHVYTQTVADGTATSVVRPSDWNSAHNQYVTLSGNTAGQSTISGTNIVFQGGNNVTLSAATAAGAATVVVSAFNQTNQTAASGNIAGTGFTSTTTAGVAIVGTNNTAGLSIGVPQFLTTAAQSSVSNVSGVIAATNNTGGGTATLSGDISFSNANSMTFYTSAGNAIVGSFSTSQSVQTQASGNIARTGVTTGATAGSLLAATLDTGGLSLGVPAWLTAAAGGGFTGGVSTGGNTSGNTGTQTGQFVLAGGNNITLSVSTAAGGAQTITISGAAAGGAQTAISGIVVSNTTYTSGTVSFSNANGISFGSSAGQAITASYTVPSTAGLISTAPFIGVSNTGNTAGNTTVFSNSTQVLAGSGSITLSQSTAAGGATAWIQHPAWLTTARASNDAIGLNTALTANGVSVTANSSGLSLNFPAFLTTAAQSSASNVSQIVAATNNTGGGTATLSGGVSFSAANGLTFYTSAGNAVVGSYTVPTVTQYFSNTATTFNGANISGSITNNTAGLNLSMSVAVPITTQALYFVGNTTGQSSSSTDAYQTISFSGAGIASLGWSAGQVIVSVPAGGGGGDGYNIVSMLTSTSGGGTAGATFSTLSGSIGLMAGSNITLSQTSNTIVINGPTGGGAAPYTASWFQPEIWGNTLTSAHANGTMYIRPFELNNYQDHDYVVFQQSMNTSATTVGFTASNSTIANFSSGGTGSWGQTGTLIMFSRVNTNETNASYNSIISYDSKTYSMGGAYSVTLSNVSFGVGGSSGGATLTTVGAVSFIKNIDASGGFTTTATTTSGTVSFSSSSTNQNSFSTTFGLSFVNVHMTGIRPTFAPGSGTDMPPGQYWLGVIQSSTTGSTGYSLQRAVMSTAGMLYFTGSGNNSYLEMGNPNIISSSNYRLGYGSYSASGNTTAAIPLSAITSMSFNASMWFAIVGQTH